MKLFFVGDFEVAMDGVVNYGFPIIHVKVDVMPEESCCFLLAAVPSDVGLFLF